MAPSPTADATRFIESSRTSPAANTPGRLVSSEYGARASDQRGAPGQIEQVATGDDEPAVVAHDRRPEPVGAW